MIMGNDFETNKERIILLISPLMAKCQTMQYLSHFALKLTHFPRESYNYYKYSSYDYCIDINNYSFNHNGENILFPNLESRVIHIDSNIAYDYAICDNLVNDTTITNNGINNINNNMDETGSSINSTNRVSATKHSLHTNCQRNTGIGELLKFLNNSLDLMLFKI